MSIFNRKPYPDEDEFGEKDLPYRTAERAMEDVGIQRVRGRPKRAVTVQRFIVMGVFFIILSFLAFTLFNSLKANNGVSQAREEIVNNSSPAFKVRYDQLGAEVIRSYYAAKSPVTNILPNVNWPGSQGSTGMESAPVEVNGLQLIRGESLFQAIPQSVLDEDETGTFSNPMNEILEYTGVIDGRQYSFTVNLIVPDVDDSTKLPYLASAPTIEPMEPLVITQLEASRPDTSGENPEFSPVELNESSLSMISDWASAYAQDNQNGLKMIAGDGNINSSYKGLGGYSLVGTPTVVWSYERKNPSDENANGQIYTRVSFVMETRVSANASSAETQVRGGEQSRTFRPVQSFDLLLDNYEEGTPNIVAWVPAGGWYHLEPRMNAIIADSEANTDGQRSLNSDAVSQAPRETGSRGEEPTSRAPGAPSLERTTTAREDTAPETSGAVSTDGNEE